jgi:hypothetical protein
MGATKAKGGMRFLNISDFNKALLGKQCWRLIQDNNSLVARMFKSRYFPRSDFMEAKVGFQPSYAWRSLLAAKEVVKAGARWVIGDGRKVKKIQDSWIPTTKGFKLQDQTVGVDPNATVSLLIDVGTKQWNRGLIYITFNNYVAKQILSIPISVRLPIDRVIWHWEKDGNYSVTSAHHVLCEERNVPIAETSMGSCDELWKRIWKLSVPKSVQIFLWRLAKNILPTRSNLEKKGIILDTFCPFCESAVENVDHLFI